MEPRPGQQLEMESLDGDGCLVVFGGCMANFGV